MTLAELTDFFDKVGGTVAALLAVLLAGLTLVISHSQRTRPLREHLYEQQVIAAVEIAEQGFALMMATQRGSWARRTGQIDSAIDPAERERDRLELTSQKWTPVLTDDVIQRSGLLVVQSMESVTPGVASDDGPSEDDLLATFRSLIGALRRQVGTTRLSAETLQLLGEAVDQPQRAEGTST